MSGLSPDEQSILLAHLTEIEEKNAALQAKLDYANAELRNLHGETNFHRPHAKQVARAPEGYTGPVGNSGQPIMTHEQAWAMSEENARIGAEANRIRLRGK